MKSKDSKSTQRAVKRSIKLFRDFLIHFFFQNEKEYIGMKIIYAIVRI
jgi:hypothetical protein